MPILTYGGHKVGSTQGSNPAIGEWIKANIRPDEVFPATRLFWPGTLVGGPIFEQTNYNIDHVVTDRLYWPWGASRFAHAHVVVDGDTLNAIRVQAYANQQFQPLPFEMDDGAYDTGIATDLWMLPARPLSTAAPGGNALWLLSLVDDRYFWWETSLQYDVTEGITTWLQLYAAIGVALGLTISADPINSAYGRPTQEYTVAYRQLPCMLDAVAWSVGQRIVRALDGSVYAQNALTAISSQKTQEALYANRKRRGGVFALNASQVNDLSALVPEAIDVVYQSDGIGRPDNGNYPVTATLATLLLGQFPQPQISGQPWTKVLHRYESAAFPGPSNVTALVSLTNQFATDWYRWQLAMMDRWHVGTVPWNPEGLNDIEWRVMNSEVLTHVKRGVFNPQEDLLFLPASASSSADCEHFYTDCIGGALIRYVRDNCDDDWREDKVLSRFASTTEERVRCGDGFDYGFIPKKLIHADCFQHIYQRQIIGGCFPEVSPWKEVPGAGCVPCCCDDHQSGSSGSTGACVTVHVPCCPNPLPCELCVRVVDQYGVSHRYRAVFDPRRGVWATLVGTCEVIFRCNADAMASIFQLVVDGSAVYSSSDDQCTWLLATFADVDLLVCAGLLGTVYVSTYPCIDDTTSTGSHASGDIITDLCCPNGTPHQLCVQVTPGLQTALMTYDKSKYWVATGLTFPVTNIQFSLRMSCTPRPLGPGSEYLMEENCGSGWEEVSFVDGSVAPSTCTPFVKGFARTGGCVGGNISLIVRSDLTLCGGDGNDIIGTDCCPDQLLPATLNAAFGLILSGLGNVTLAYDPTAGFWKAVVPPTTCGVVLIGLTCGYAEQEWLIAGSDADDVTVFQNIVPVDVSSCDPFMLNFDTINIITGSCTGNTGACTVT